MAVPMICCLTARKSFGLQASVSIRQNTHGTGCTLSSSLAANLAQGMSIKEAVAASKAYVTKAIEYSLPIGSGCGPTHHFVDLYRKAGWLK